MATRRPRILIEATSGSVLFEKNADELRAPSSMMKLMTAEVVFHAIKQGDIKLTDEYHVSENAWRKGGAPSGTSTMFASIHSKIFHRRSPARRHHSKRQRRLHRAGRRNGRQRTRVCRDDDQTRARTRDGAIRPLPIPTGCPIPATR